MISEGRWRGGRAGHLSDGKLPIESDSDVIVAVDDFS